MKLSSKYYGAFVVSITATVLAFDTLQIATAGAFWVLLMCCSFSAMLFGRFAAEERHGLHKEEEPQLEEVKGQWER